jgi:hypothetical protein
MIAVMMAIWLGYTVVAGFVLAIDPYDVYPWGKGVSIPENFAPFEIPRIMRIAARDQQTELVLIGTSPTTIFDQADIESAYPGYVSPWNVSYHGSAVADRARTIDQFIRYSPAKRYLITLDYFYTKRAADVRPAFPDFQYDETPLNDLRMVSSVTIKAAVRALRSGSPFPDARATANQEHAFRMGERRRFQTPERMRSLRSWIKEYRAVIDKPSRLSCSDLPSLNTLLSQVNALTAKGARVDVLIPPYSPAIFYEWAGDPRLRRGGGSETFLMDQLTMRKCAVEGISRIRGAHIFAMDLDVETMSDLGNFRDPAHMENAAGLAKFIGMPNHPDLELTASNVDAYVKRLHRTVVDYELANSNID